MFKKYKELTKQLLLHGKHIMCLAFWWKIKKERKIIMAYLIVPQSRAEYTGSPKNHFALDV
jgi:hypothetical protein